MLKRWPVQLAPEGFGPLLAFGIILAGTAVVTLARVPRAYGLGLLVLAVWFVQSFTENAEVALALSISTGDVLAGAAWWTPFTYMFVHADFLHLVGNLLILLTAGPALEDRVGGRWFLAVYFLAGFAAAGAHLALTATGVVVDGLALGASGAIFGVLTAFAVRYPREQLPLTLGFIILPMPAFVVLLVHLGLNLAIMLRDSGGIAWYGHFAGYLVGLAAALWFERHRIDSRREGARGRREFPDVAKLRALSTSAEMDGMLEKAETFTGENRDDAEFANAWVDRFLARARCPAHDAPLARSGFTAYCPHGDLMVEFAKRT